MTYHRTLVILVALLSQTSRASDDIAAKISAAAGFDPIDLSSSEPEFRVWRSIALLDEIEGWIVTPGLVRVYSGSSLDSIVQVTSIPTPEADELLAELETLATYNGQRLYCARIKDGWSLEVEGLSSKDGYFAVSASTPNICTEGPAHELAEVYRQLSVLSSGTP